MTNLNRTPLTTSQKVDCAIDVLSMQAYGDKKEISERYGLSRPTLYEVEQTAEGVLNDYFECGGYTYIKVDQCQLERAIVGARVVTPGSLRNIEDLIPIFYPGIKCSYGEIQKVTIEAGLQAGERLKEVDLSAIKESAVDEMFSQGDPVLAGIDLDSGYLFGLSHDKHRGSDDWCRFLEEGKKQGLDLEVVIKDRAVGIAAGVKKAFPEAEQRDDCFHLLYELNKVRSLLERKAYGAIQSEADAIKKLDKIDWGTKGSNDKWFAQEPIAYQATEQCERAIEQFDLVDQAVKKVRRALICVDLDEARLRSGDEAEQLIKEAAEEVRAVDHHRCKKVATYTYNCAEGVTLATHNLMNRLTALYENYSTEVVLLACLLWQALEMLDKTNSSPRQRFLERYAAGTWALLKKQDKESWEEAYQAVKQELEHHHRASSAIEGFNSTLRPHLYVHKSVSQNFLDLFSAHYNFRTRRWGKHKGTSAHEVLTGQVVGDWLTEIGYPPSKKVH